MWGRLLKVCVAVTVAGMGTTAATEVGCVCPSDERVMMLEELVSRLAVVVVGDSDGHLGRRVEALEQEAVMLTLLNSRLKSLEAEQHLLNEELANVRRSSRRWRREVEALKQEVVQCETLAERKADQYYLSLNDTILKIVAKREHEVNASLSDLRRRLHNLTHDLHDLQQQTRHQPLLLCPKPYVKVGGQCFHLLTGRRNWAQSRMACREQGVAVGGHGDLATPANFTTFRLYIEALQTDSSFLWVGAVREAGKWRWVSSAAQGEDLMSVPWDYGEPDNTPDQHQLCVHSLGSIKFHDCTRTAMLSAVCQVT
ncbi:C-type lectin domain family 4 member M-like [Portunus trituberculatus]|uniref:C-type lectin domain family 4 member M-like n=1 Tax=Portunus trituberculatus TaxID=210409 RepID=UPI001E1D174F|nr:C-type lectin domain family 4 member M-like [Portunus trituberculatus]